MPFQTCAHRIGYEVGSAGIRDRVFAARIRGFGLELVEQRRELGLQVGHGTEPTTLPPA